ncbi:VOC family protein [Aeromicrobium duanguangcaii]|uniref:VOC family protein n=1 Tax=Aeromicrobium duanguangcaii TaxID=2968086 RepID=UPI0020173664|nr:VOC family protein [Aeromicrobium duanguangcaii]MCL3837159.1 VOC family protein [Aeromicrobium duanguangcaii]
MTSRLEALVLDANDPARLAAFWGSVLERNVVESPDDDGVLTLTAPDDVSFPIDIEPTRHPKRLRNRMHFDLTSSSSDDQQATVERVLSLGGRHSDVGQLPAEPHVVLADPEGNEFCVLGPDNRFTAGCGRIGTLSCDGSRATGEFWQAALDWLMVWDEGDETAIQSPHGGTKISWGGPPLMEKPPKNRWHLDIRPYGDQAAEVERLERLGAARTDIGQGKVSWVVMRDPDGNEFCVLSGARPA